MKHITSSKEMATFRAMFRAKSFQGATKPVTDEQLERMARMEAEMAKREKPCKKCGYPFDYDRAGRYGCPNCHGEGLT